MIKFKDIHEKCVTHELSVEETKVLEEVILLTDKAIDSQYQLYGYVEVDADEVDRRFSPFGNFRRSVLLDHWKKECNKHGWTAEYSGGRSNSVWTLRGNI